MRRGAFHSSHGWHWCRLEDGSVQLERRETHIGTSTYVVTHRHVMDAATWESVIKAVSLPGPMLMEES